MGNYPCICMVLLSRGARHYAKAYSDDNKEYDLCACAANWLCRRVCFFDWKSPFYLLATFVFFSDFYFCVTVLFLPVVGEGLEGALNSSSDNRPLN